MLFKYDCYNNKADLYLDVEDYITLLSEEIAYGKKLKVFNGVLEMLTEDPDTYRTWMDDSRYTPERVEQNLRILLDILENIRTNKGGN